MSLDTNQVSVWTNEPVDEYISKHFFQLACSHFVSNNPKKDIDKKEDDQIIINQTKKKISKKINILTKFLQHDHCAVCGLKEKDHHAVSDSKIKKNICKETSVNIPESCDGKEIPCSTFGTLVFEDGSFSAEFLRASKDSFDPCRYLDYLHRYIGESSTSTHWENKGAIAFDKVKSLITIIGAKNSKATPIFDGENSPIEKSQINIEEQILKICLLSNGIILSEGQGKGLIRREEATKMQQELEDAKAWPYISIGFSHWHSLSAKETLANVPKTGMYLYPKQVDDTYLDKNHTHQVLIDDRKESSKGAKEALMSFEKCIKAKFLNLIQLRLFVCGTLDDLALLKEAGSDGAGWFVVKAFGGIADLLVEAHDQGLRRNDYENYLDHFCKSHEMTPAHVKAEIQPFITMQHLHFVDAIKNPQIMKVFLLDEFFNQVESLPVMIKVAAHDHRPSTLRNVLRPLSRALFSDNVTMNTLFMESLIGKQSKIIKCLLRKGFNLKAFNSDTLTALYRDLLCQEASFGALLGRHRSSTKAPLELREVDEVINKFIGGGAKQYLYKKYDNDFPKGSKIVISPERDLFILSLFNLDLKTSLLFWNLVTNKMAGALFACCILKGMQKRYSEKEEVIGKMLCFYEQIAIEILNKVWQSGLEYNCKELVFMNHSEWGMKSCVDLAELSGCKRFFAERPISQILRICWRGRVPPQTSIILHIFCIFTLLPGLFMLPWVYRKNGIKYTMSGMFIRYIEIEHKSNSKISTCFSPFKVLQTLYGSPLSRYCFQTLYEVGLIISQSYLVLILFQEVGEIEPLEWILFGCNCLKLTEEVREFVNQKCSWRHKPRYYSSDVGNIFDLTTIGLYLAATGIHYFYPNSQQTMDYVHGLYNLSLLFNYFKLVQSFCLLPILGPYIIMIGEMLKDLGLFLIVLLIFIVGYGVTSQSTIFPNASGPNIHWELTWGIFLRPYTHIMGENWMVIFPMADNCTYSNAALMDECTHSYFRPAFSLFLFVGYTVLVNLVLVNLLIAIFSNTYETVRSQSDLYYNMNFYIRAIKEYGSKPILPPPFTLLAFFHTIFKAVFSSTDPQSSDDKLLYYECEKMIASGSKGLPVDALREDFFGKEADGKQVYQGKEGEEEEMEARDQEWKETLSSINTSLELINSRIANIERQNRCT